MFLVLALVFYVQIEIATSTFLWGWLLAWFGFFGRFFLFIFEKQKKQNNCDKKSFLRAQCSYSIVLPFQIQQQTKCQSKGKKEILKYRKELTSCSQERPQKSTKFIVWQTMSQQNYYRIFKISSIIAALHTTIGALLLPQVVVQVFFVINVVAVVAVIKV